MHNKTLTKQEVIKAIFDPEIRKEFPVIQSYLSASNLFINDSILNEIKAEIENELIESLRYFCYLYYYIMEQKNSWGDAGEQQVKVSFCRNLLDIDPDIDITEQDVNSFFIKVKTDLLNLGISKISLDELQKIFDEYSFRVLGKDFDINEVFILSDIILFAGSKLFLQGGLHGNEIQIILGNGTIQSLGEYSVIWLEKELVRSPNTIMAMAAIIGDKNIYIRKEALTAIFFQKWISFIQHSYFTETSSDTDVYTIIADKLKERTIYLYKAMSLELLKAVEDSFINDMGETILYHELGHGIIQHKILPVTSGSIGEASRIYGENIMTALLEVLADIAPDCDNISGPLLNIFKNSLTDRIRASRMYYMYLSDTWFFDTDDEYMYIYSDIISLILLKLINPDGSVRFNELSELCDINNQESILKFLVDNMIIISRKIEDITRDAVFCVDGKKFDYNALKIKIKTGLKNDYPEIIDDTYLFHVGCWNLVMEHTRDYSDKREELESCFELEKQRVMKELFIKIAGSDTARNYRYDNRKYLADTLLKINI